ARLLEGAYNPGIAALAPDTGEIGACGKGIRRHLLRRAVVPVAVDLGRLDAVVVLKHVVTATGTLLIDESAGYAAHHQDVALAAGLVDQELGPLLADFVLVLVDRDRLFSGHDIVEGD